jgi:hypothetical protein
MHFVDAMVRVFLIAAAICGVVAALFSVALCRAVWRIPNLPLSVSINPFNILAHRDLWTPSVGSASRKLTIAAASMVAFILLAAAAACPGLRH